MTTPTTIVPTATASATTERPFGRLMRYLEHRRARLGVATTYSVLNKIFDLAPPLLIGLAVDVV